MPDALLLKEAFGSRFYDLRMVRIAFIFFRSTRASAALRSSPHSSSPFSRRHSHAIRWYRPAAKRTSRRSARLLIVCLMITPLTILFKGYRWPRWLMKQRRYIGVAAFGYALLHAVFYLIDKGTLSGAVAELSRTYIWLG